MPDFMAPMISAKPAISARAWSRRHHRRGRHPLMTAACAGSALGWTGAARAAGWRRRRSAGAARAAGRAGAAAVSGARRKSSAASGAESAGTGGRPAPARSGGKSAARSGKKRRRRRSRSGAHASSSACRAAGLSQRSNGPAPRCRAMSFAAAGERSHFSSWAFPGSPKGSRFRNSFTCVCAGPRLRRTTPISGRPAASTPNAAISRWQNAASPAKSS